MQDSILFRLPLVMKFLTVFCGLTLGSAVLATVYGGFSWFHRSASLATAKS